MTVVPAVVKPVPASVLQDPHPAPGSLVEAVLADDDALLYLLLNVGDGDCQVLLLPRDTDGVRRIVVVDVGISRKAPALLQSLHDCGLLTQPPGYPGQLRLLVTTHPHADHIGGLPELLRLYGGVREGEGGDRGPWIDQLWEPGYYVPNQSFYELMRQLEDTEPFRSRLQPTAGTSIHLDAVKVTVVGPAVRLRNRFDTYGVGINDSSITLMVEYPASTIFCDPDPVNDGRQNRRMAPQKGHRLLLGGDAQFTSWAQATVDFPDLSHQTDPDLAKELASGPPPDYLAAELFKLSHHASKHGINVELLERVGARLALVSATDGGGRYRFPHQIAMEAAREAREATTTSGKEHSPDYELGIHLTGAHLEGDGAPLGSIAVLVPRTGSALRLFRLMDAPGDPVGLENAREVRS